MGSTELKSFWLIKTAQDVSLEPLDRSGKLIFMFRCVLNTVLKWKYEIPAPSRCTRDTAKARSQNDLYGSSLPLQCLDFVKHRRGVAEALFVGRTELSFGS